MRNEIGKLSGLREHLILYAETIMCNEIIEYLPNLTWFHRLFPDMERSHSILLNRHKWLVTIKLEGLNCRIQNRGGIITWVTRQMAAGLNSQLKYFNFYDTFHLIISAFLKACPRSSLFSIGLPFQSKFYELPMKLLKILQEAYVKFRDIFSFSAGAG